MKILPKKLESYKGIIYFIVILFLSNFFWKLTVKGDESDSLVTFFGMDISAPFNFMVYHITDTVSSILHFFGSNVLRRNNTLSCENGHSIRIIWGCSGIKQAYIFFCIIAFTRGPWKKKLWYIPVGLFVVYLFNILRIAIIVALVKNHFEWFHFLHEYFFKYLFYGVIFFMWVFWDERIATKNMLPEEEDDLQK